MIKFKTLSFRNFLSTGNVPNTYMLDRVPSVLITGQNGAGKSTMLDALCFGLFGKAYRNINKGQLVNTVNDKGLLVELEFTINSVPFKVIRGLKPGKFEIYRNDVLVEHDAASKDYQRYLESQLGLNFKAFTQIVVLGSARYQSFMQLSTNDRRVIIEEILDITVFTRMNQVLKQRTQENDLNIKDNDYHKEINKTKISGTTALIKNLTNRTKESEDKIAENRRNLESQIELIDDQITALDERIGSIEITDDLEKVRDEMSGAKHKAKEVETKYKHNQDRISFYDNNDHCHVCEQSIDETIKSNQIEVHSEANEQLDKMKPMIVEAFKKLEERLSAAEDLHAKLRDLEQERMNLANERKTTLRMIDNLENSTKESDENALQEAGQTLVDQETKQRELVKEGNQLLELQHYYEICKVLLKDQGIKAKIIKQYLPIINQLVNQYLDRMGANYSFNLNENFTEVIKSRYRDTFSYASFSEGEKSRIDLSLMFTWREIAKLKNSINTNLLIMDEVSDGSLDAEATDVLWEIIADMTDTNVYVISHKQNNIDKFTTHIEIVKDGNFSKIKHSKL